MTPTARPRPPRREPLPTPLRVVRIAELLFFPVACFLLLGLPVPSLERPSEVAATVLIAAEAFAAVAVHVGLGRRKLWAWWLALVLACWVLVGVLVRIAPVVGRAIAGRDVVSVLTASLLAWTFATQAAALLGALAVRDRVRTLS